MLRGHHTPDLCEAGCDEAGRGCLAGPVFAAAVILPRGFADERLNDSKQLTEKQRDELRPVIEKHALAWAVATVDAAGIDEINILRASILAMHKAVDRLQLRPGLLLIDGNRFSRYPGIPHLCVVRGDATYLAIAAASVLAKTHRDAYMTRIHAEFPVYGWDRNKGYPSAFHRKAIRQAGPSPYHRMTFRLLPPATEIDRLELL